MESEAKAQSRRQDTVSMADMIVAEPANANALSLTAVEETTLSSSSKNRPRAATLLVAHVRRRRAKGLSPETREVPGRPAHEVPFSAEDGWAWDGEIDWDRP